MVVAPSPIQALDLYRALGSAIRCALPPSARRCSSGFSSVYDVLSSLKVGRKIGFMAGFEPQSNDEMPMF